MVIIKEKDSKVNKGLEHLCNVWYCTLEAAQLNPELAVNAKYNLGSGNNIYVIHPDFRHSLIIKKDNNERYYFILRQLMFEEKGESKYFPFLLDKDEAQNLINFYNLTSNIVKRNIFIN